MTNKTPATKVVKKIDEFKEISEIVKTLKPCVEASQKQYEILFTGPLEHTIKMSKAKTQAERIKITKEGIKKTFSRGKALAIASVKCSRAILPLI